MDTQKLRRIHTQNADELCKRIEEASGKEVQDILNKAQKEKEKLLSEAQGHASSRGKEILKAAQKDIEKIKERIFSKVNIEKKKLFMGEKAGSADAVLKNVRDLADKFRKDDGYRQFLEKAIIEGVKVIDTDAVDIVYSELDEKLMSDNFIQAVQKACHDKFHKNISLRFIKSDFKDIGVLVQSGDARLMYDNRFSARLKRMYDDIYMALLKESV